MTQHLQYSRSDRNQELVEASEEGVGHVTRPDVTGGTHEEQQTSLRCSDQPNCQLRPDRPFDLHKSCRKWRDRSWEFDRILTGDIMHNTALPVHYILNEHVQIHLFSHCASDCKLKRR